MNEFIFIKNGIHPAMIRDKYICQYCGRDGLESPENWRNFCVDHFMPKSLGGSDDLNNLVTACGYCNALKGKNKFDTIKAVRSYIIKRKSEDSDFVNTLRTARQETK